MSFDLYYNFHRWAMRTSNPRWRAHLQRLELMYPPQPRYISPAVQGY